MKKLILSLTLLFVNTSILFAEEKIDLIPSSGYDRAGIYLNLALFWIGIIVLIVLLKMKLREIERVQALGTQEDEEKLPLLE